MQVSVIGCNISLLEITLGAKRMTTFNASTTLDYTKIGDVKPVHFLTEQFDVKTRDGWSNVTNKVLHSILVPHCFESMNLNITIWFVSDDILKALDTMEKDYSDCFTDDINKMKDLVNEYYDSEWVIEMGF